MTNTTKEYTATTVRFNLQGEMLEDVGTFLASPDYREALKEANEFVQGADEWIIWDGDEMLDHNGPIPS